MLGADLIWAVGRILVKHLQMEIWFEFVYSKQYNRKNLFI